MMMRKTARAVALMGATAILGLGMGIGPAFATAAAPAVTKTWTVKPGGKFKSKSGTTVLNDTTSKVKLKCKSSAAIGTLKRGSKLKGAKIGKITKVTFTHCIGPLSLHFTVKTSDMPWFLNAVSYNKKTGVTKGTITGIDANLSSGTGCTLNVDGTAAKANDGMVKASYSNKTHKLTILAGGDNLHVYSVSAGCSGLVATGDATSFHAVYAVSPHQKIVGR